MENDSGLNQQSTEFEWTICGCRKEIEAAKMVIQTEQQSLPKIGVKYSMLCEVQSLVCTLQWILQKEGIICAS